MTEIFELSRDSQLTDPARDIVAKVAIEYGVTVTDLATHIYDVVHSIEFNDAAKAAYWYFDAHRFAVELANEFNTTVEIAAAIVSAVSPRMPWLRNKVVARTILAKLGSVASLSAIDAAKTLGMGLSVNVAMAIKIARGADIGETLTGIKRRSFYNNIIAPDVSDSVTVDTWMIMAFCHVTGADKATGLKFVTANEKALKGTGAGYFMIADAVRSVADDMNMMPHQVQAIYWVAVSGSQNGGRTDIN